MSFFSTQIIFLPEENIIFRTNPHWLYFAVPTSVIVIVGIAYLALMPLFFPEDIPFLHLFPFLFSATCILLIIIIFLNWYCIRYYLTNFRLIEERGIVGKRTISIWLRKVQDVSCSFGILGRIFGFGDIEVKSAGTYGKIIFDFLPTPRILKYKIEKATHDYHHPSI
jgi:membrane protein YdbS with pleckstrin-like domain